MCCWQLRARRSRLHFLMEGLGCWKARKATDLIMTQTLCWGSWILLNSFHFLLSSATRLSFSECMENTFHMTYSHRPPPLGMGKWASDWFSQINFQSNWASFFFFFHWTFSCAFSEGLLILAHFQARNIFTISRNSIWAPASINFSTIAKCPAKHALWRAVRLYCRRLKQEIVVRIKMCIIL